MAEAFTDADIVYPKSWAPYEVMQRRTELLKAGDSQGLDELEAECLELNKRYLDWECGEELMKLTDEALYLHCLPADISGVSCERGEVSAPVFERFRLATYRQAGYKPYVIAAVMLLSKVKNPTAVFSRLLQDHRTARETV
jgi:ornithine carbamoyltransferase